MSESHRWAIRQLLSHPSQEAGQLWAELLTFPLDFHPDDIAAFNRAEREGKNGPQD